MVTGLIKFSDERNKRFSIKTIVDRHCQPPVVRKECIYEEGRKHIKNIYDYQKGLKEYFPNVNICNAYLKDDGIIEFDYLDGTSLEDEYIKAAINSDKNRFEEILEKHKEIILGGENNQCEFSENQDYDEWFGTGEKYYGKAALKYANFDAIPSNIICVNDVPYFIDYEWVMEFTMPLDLVIYNCIDNLYMKNRFVQDFYPEEKALEYMGVNTDVDVLKKSYMHFFDYIICDGEGNSYAKDKITCLKKKETLPQIREEWEKCANEWKNSVEIIEQKEDELATANREWQNCANEWKKTVEALGKKDKELANANREWQNCANEWKKAVAIVEQKDEELATANREWQNCADEWKKSVQIINQRDESIAELRRMLDAVKEEKTIVEKEKSDYRDKYEAIINSKSWRMVSKVKRILRHPRAIEDK